MFDWSHWNVESSNGSVLQWFAAIQADLSCRTFFPQYTVKKKH